MSTITTQDGVEIFYKDWGPKDGQPIMFHHGWPLSSDDWDAQMLYFVQQGYRVVAHELSHLRVMDHSPRFWETVESVVPDYHVLRKQLKDEAVPKWS